MKELVLDIIDALENYKDDNRKEKGKSYYPTRMKILGVTNPNQKLVLRELNKITSPFLPQEKIMLAKELTQTNIFECQSIAYEYIGKDNNIISQISQRDVYELCVHPDNWVTVDTYSIYIYGKAWRNNILNLQHVKELLSSANFWIRRIAIVSTIPLNLKSQGGKGDAIQTLEICKQVVSDYQPLIIKALSWALRELSKTNKASVEEFITTFEKQLHPQIIQEVTNKLTTGRKTIK